MSKSAKNKKALERKKMKAAKKEANRAKYAGWRDAGQNGKRQKIARKKKKRTIRFIRHRLGACHNVGCKRCFPTKES